MSRSPSFKNLFAAALAGLLCGTLGETLLFLEAQARRVESVLAEDFRIVAFLAADLPEAGRKELEGKLGGLPGTREVRFVSRDEALEGLRGQDPELMRSVALLGENPLQSAFEATLAPESIARAPQWADAASELPGVGDIRFKPMQAQAVVQCQFYARFLRLALSLAAFFWLAGSAASLLAALRLREARGVVAGLPARVAMAGIGSAGGMGLVLAAALPLKASPVGWAAPALWSQACLFLIGLLGALAAWDWSGAAGGLAAEPSAPRELAAAP